MMRNLERKEQSDEYSKRLVFYHLCTFVAYWYCLVSGALNGIFVIWFLCEVPVLWMAYREICVCYEAEMIYPLTPVSTRALWTYLPLTWHMFRTLPCLLWPISLLLWRSHLSRLGIQDLVILNCLGGLNSYASYVLFAQIFPRLKMEDAIRSGIVKLQEPLEWPNSELPLENDKSTISRRWVAYLGEQPTSPHLLGVHRYEARNNYDYISPSFNLFRHGKCSLSLFPWLKGQLSSFSPHLPFATAQTILLVLLIKLFAELVETSSPLSISSPNFAAVLSLSFKLTLSLMTCGLLLTLPFAFSGRNLLALILSKSLNWRMHISAVAYLFWQCAENAAIMTSFARDGDASFLKITLLGTLTIELCVKYVTDIFRSDKNIVGSCWITMLLVVCGFVVVIVNAFEHEIITPTCGQLFFISNCNTEKDKQQTFLCLIFTAALASRFFFARCISFCNNVDFCSLNVYATCTSICQLGALYGFVLLFFLTHDLNCFRPYENMSESMILYSCGAALCSMLCFYLFTASILRSSAQYAMLWRVLPLILALLMSSFVNLISWTTLYVAVAAVFQLRSKIHRLLP